MDVIDTIKAVNALGKGWSCVQRDDTYTFEDGSVKVVKTRESIEKSLDIAVDVLKERAKQWR